MSERVEAVSSQLNIDNKGIDNIDNIGTGLFCTQDGQEVEQEHKTNEISVKKGVFKCL